MTDQISKDKLPEIKRETIGEEKVTEFKITDSKGKEHDAKHVEKTEKEIDSTNLVKIAPMFYFCPDNNKVLLIPFSIQFSATEILQLVAKLAHNLNKELEKVISDTKKEIKKIKEDSK